MVRTAFVAAALCLAAPAAAQQPAVVLQPGETLLEVQAEGQVRVRPDSATLTIGVVATGDTALAATNAAARTMTGIASALRAKGVAAREIRTQQINVDPRFQRSNPADYQGQATITGYVARNTATVMITRLDTASDVIAAAFGAGANSVNGPSIGTQDPGAGMTDARRAAIAAARAEADEYAAGLAMRVARVIRVSERGSNVRATGDVVVMGSRISYASAPPPPPPPPPAVATPFAAGDLLRTTTLWVDFALVPR